MSRNREAPLRTICNGQPFILLLDQATPRVYPGLNTLSSTALVAQGKDLASCHSRFALDLSVSRLHRDGTVRSACPAVAKPASKNTGQEPFIDRCPHAQVLY